MSNRRNRLRRMRKKRNEKRARILTADQLIQEKDLSEQTKIIQLDDAQTNAFLNELTQRIEWATNRIVDEKVPVQVTVQNPSVDSRGFPWLLKCTVGVPIILFGVGIVGFLLKSAGEYWAQSWAMRLMIVFLAVIAFDCFGLGVEIFREKDRNYLVALFSALVSLVALIVTLTK